MGQIIAGPGQGLQLPQGLYPTQLLNAPIDVSGNRIGLAPGDELPIPAGSWYVHTGSYSVIEWLDPITGIWTMGPNAAWIGGMQYIKSDGFSVRIANRTGCPVSASVTGAGSGYAAASTTITVAGGNSQWVPVVGGALGVSGTMSPTTSGGGYGVAPLLLIPPPPAGAAAPNGVGGISATGYAVISSGSVTGVTLTNPGAGYTAAGYTIALVPNPSDPNISAGITLATVVLALSNAGSIMGALCINPGAPITPANITLAVAGAGTNATIVPNVLQSVTAGSVIGGGTGPYGTVSAQLTTVGGAPVAGSITNSPEFLRLAFRPRPAQITLVVAAAGSIAPQAGTILDGGLFMSAPTAILGYGAQGAATGSVAGTPTVSLTMGSQQDFVMFQPAP